MKNLLCLGLILGTLGAYAQRNSGQGQQQLHLMQMQHQQQLLLEQQRLEREQQVEEEYLFKVLNKYPELIKLGFMAEVKFSNAIRSLEFIHEDYSVKLKVIYNQMVRVQKCNLNADRPLGPLDLVEIYRHEEQMSLILFKKACSLHSELADSDGRYPRLKLDISKLYRLVKAYGVEKTREIYDLSPARNRSEAYDESRIDLLLDLI